MLASSFVDATFEDFLRQDSLTYYDKFLFTHWLPLWCHIESVLKIPRAFNIYFIIVIIVCYCKHHQLKTCLAEERWEWLTTTEMWVKRVIPYCACRFPISYVFFFLLYYCVSCPVWCNNILLFRLSKYRRRCHLIDLAVSFYSIARKCSLRRIYVHSGFQWSPQKMIPWGIGRIWTWWC